MEKEITRRIEELEKRVTVLERTVHQNKGVVNVQRQDFILSKEKILEENQDRAKTLFSFTEEGDFTLTFDKSKMTTEDKIVLYLISKAYAKSLGLTDIDTANNKEISEKMQIPYNSTHGGIANQLRRKGIMRSEKGSHRIEYSKIPQLLDTLTKNLI